MTLGELEARAADRALARGELSLRLGPFTVRLRSRLPDVRREVARLYADQPLAGEDFADFHVEVASPGGLRRWVRPQVEFLQDGRAPFKPLPRSQAVPVLEWGLNWCVASQAHQYLVLHAAVIERGGRAAILPGDPGSGKSTLCAALVHEGWRLLSDELALLDLVGGQLHGLSRPVSLKNESIDVIARRVPSATLSERFTDTAKGTIALMKPPADSVRRVAEPARPAWVVMPEFTPGAPATMDPVSRATTFMELGRNGFNYSIQGAAGFDALAALVDACDCYHFRYSSLDDAAAEFLGLADGAAS